MLAFFGAFLIFFLASVTFYAVARSVWLDRCSKRHVSRRRLNLRALARIEKIVEEMSAIGAHLEVESVDDTVFLKLYESALCRVDVLLQTALQCDSYSKFAKLELAGLKALIDSCDQRLRQVRAYQKVFVNRRRRICQITPPIRSSVGATKETNGLRDLIQTLEGRVDRFHQYFRSRSR